MDACFISYGDVPPASPVVLSVPHAGRCYPEGVRDSLRVPFAALTMLEDRLIDSVAMAARGGETTLIQQAARAWIDLNRAEDDRDPMLDDGARTGHLSAKVRSGLGLVPRRTTAAGELWRKRLSADDVIARINAVHRPYHAALAAALAAARARFGVAVLLDLHSMPPIRGSRTRIVIGDRFGRSADSSFVNRVEAAVAAAHLPQALNVPYAGGYILERHGAPEQGIHAIQLEIDRSLYLDSRMDGAGPGHGRVVHLVREILDALADEAIAGLERLAAE